MLGVAFVINALFETSGLRGGVVCPSKHGTVIAINATQRTSCHFTMPMLADARGRGKSQNTDSSFLVSWVPD
jgi:hypothetical protein